jgi:hypothetical protein
MAAALAALGLAAAALAGCGSGSSSSKDAAIGPAPTKAAAATTTPSPTATATATATAAAKTETPSSGDPTTHKAKLGATLTLSGSGLHDDVNDHRKTLIKVTLKDQRGPFQGFDLPANRKLIGVDLHFVNIGKLRYDDALPSGTLTLSGGETGKPTQLIPGSGANPCPTPSLKLKTGQSKDVCVAFEVPKSAKPIAYQYVTDSGYGDTGLWKLK